MKEFWKVKTLQKELNRLRKEGLKIGFTPTMGALHSGHVSLLKRSKSENDISVVSIFVNPTQFNQKKDLKLYPRPISKDREVLNKAGNHILFKPFVSEIYPADFKSFEFDLEGLDILMEGTFRPGHFEGVAQVVLRLLSIVQPDRLYMGQKDFQQFTIIEHLINQLELPTELVVCPIEREENGLAKSSRNVRLTAKNRSDAAIICATLNWAKVNYQSESIADITKTALRKMEVNPEFRPEYFTIIDGYTLKPVQNTNAHKYIVACTAVWAGDVRLIDNIILKKEA